MAATPNRTARSRRSPRASARGYPHEVWTRLRAEAPVLVPHRRDGSRSGDHEARRYPFDLEEAAAFLECAGIQLRAATKAVVGDGGHARSPRHGPVRRVATRASRRRPCGRGMPTSSGSRSRSWTHRHRRVGRASSISWTHRRAVSARGDRTAPRRAARGLGVAVQMEQRGDRPRRSGVPAPRRDARSAAKRARGSCTLFRAPGRAAPD